MEIHTGAALPTCFSPTLRDQFVSYAAECRATNLSRQGGFHRLTLENFNLYLALLRNPKLKAPKDAIFDDKLAFSRAKYKVKHEFMLKDHAMYRKPTRKFPEDRKIVLDEEVVELIVQEHMQGRKGKHRPMTDVYESLKGYHAVTRDEVDWVTKHCRVCWPALNGSGGSNIDHECGRNEGNLTSVGKDAGTPRKHSSFTDTGVASVPIIERSNEAEDAVTGDIAGIGQVEQVDLSHPQAASSGLASSGVDTETPSVINQAGPNAHGNVFTGPIQRPFGGAGGTKYRQPSHKPVRKLKHKKAEANEKAGISHEKVRIIIPE